MEPISPYSSAPQLQNTMLRRGRQPEMVQPSQVSFNFMYEIVFYKTRSLMFIINRRSRLYALFHIL